MNPFQLFYKIAMVVIAITIGFLYINPTISKIKSTQDMSQIYMEEATKVASVNKQLSDRLHDIDSLTLSNKQALLIYLPDKIDDVSVLKDLNTILKQQQIVANSLVCKGPVIKKDNNEVVETSWLTTHQFEIVADVTYAQLKELLGAIEINNYPLQVALLTVDPSENGFLIATLLLSAFSREIIIPTDDQV